MPFSRTQHGDPCGDRTQDLSIRSPTLYHYATAIDHILGSENLSVWGIFLGLNILNAEMDAVFICKIWKSCADPEIFMRWGPTKMVIFGHRRGGG